MVASVMPMLSITAEAAEWSVKAVGRPVVGETLTAQVSGKGGPFSYQWYRGIGYIDKQAITGATDASYTLTQEDVDHNIFVKINSDKESLHKLIYNPATVMVIDCGDTNWTYKFWKENVYQNVTTNSSGIYDKVRFYNATQNNITFNLSGVTPISVDGVSIELSSSSISTMLSSAPTATGASVAYNASEHNITVTPIFEAPVHVHTFTYETSDNKIIATCGNTDGKCALPNDHKATLTANVPTYKGKDITISDIFSDDVLDKFNTATGLSVSASDIKIYNENDEELEDNIIKQAGVYKIKFSIAGVAKPIELTIIVTSQAPQPQQGSGSSIVNAPGADGILGHIQNKYVGGALLDINFKLFLSASDFVTQKITEAVENVIKYDSTLQNQADFDTYGSNMFGFAVTHKSALSFLQRVLLALFL